MTNKNDFVRFLLATIFLFLSILACSITSTEVEETIEVVESTVELIAETVEQDKISARLVKTT